MSTSQKTRKYWVEKAKGWAEDFLTHPDYDGSPQLDEFNQVMDELLEASEKLEEDREWRPMTTAPLDGTPILLVENGQIYKAHWQQIYYVVPNEEDPFGWCISESYQDEQGGFATVNHPSGWRPLPALKGGGE